MWTLLITSAVAQSSGLPQDRVALLPEQQGPSMSAMWQGDRIAISDGETALLYQASDLSLLDSHRVNYWDTSLLSQDGSTWVTSKRRTKVWDTESLDKLAGLSGSTLAIDPVHAHATVLADASAGWVYGQGGPAQSR